MGIFRSLFGRPDPVVALALDPDSGPKFVVDADSVPPEVFGLTSYADPIAPAPRVDRRSAMQVPAVKRSRDLIATAIGGLPLQTYRQMNGATVGVTTALLEQPEPDVPRTVTMANTAEDMFFEKYAWWRVIERDANRWPLKVRRLNPRSVDTGRGDNKVWYRKDGTTQGESWEWIPDEDLIRFESPNDPFLVAGARAVRTSLQLDATASQYAAEPQAREYFTPKPDAEPINEDEVRKILTDWNNGRRTNATGWVNGALDLHAGNLISPRDLQLADARQHAVLEIARAAGVDPEELGVSTTSRTYANQFDRRKAFLDFTLGGYLLAIEGRLSMGDVTPRGQYVKFNLDAFLRSDTAARYAAYAVGLSNKFITVPEVRELEDLPALPEEETVQEPTNDNVVQMRPPAAAAGHGVQLSADAGLTMSTHADQRFEVDLDKRTISGLAMPYGGAQGFHEGVAYEFSKGSIKVPADPSRVKMFVQHDPNRAVGYATKLEDTDDGLFVSFKIAATPAGDEALLMADSKVWDGLSAGFLPGSKFRTTKNGAQFAVEAPIREVSLCPSPAFEDARVSAVALTADNEGIITMTDTTVTPAAPAPETAVADQVAAELAKYGLKPGQTLQFDAVTKAIEDGFANLQAAAAGPTAVPAVPGSNTAQFAINEELPYRFNASTRGEFGFVEDLRDMQHGNAAAKQRLETFLEEVWNTPAFAVSTTNVASFNPVQNRPDMYVPQLDYQRPLWESASNGVIDSITAFTIPKFSSASGLVGTHTQGVEPTPGAFAATVQTVTPNAISGKIEINREVLDQGGSPQTDTIVWQEMQRAYWEGIETNIAAMLNSLSAATLYTGAEINLAGAVDAALDTALTNLFADLQYVRGGNRYTAFVADGSLYKAVVAAKDTAGRKLYPMLGPTNANGQVEPVLAAANVLGRTVRPAWALGSGNDKNSYMFVPSSVWAWASAPKRFTFEYQVKSVDMAIWGYAASAVLRNTDVARIDYTTADV